MPYPDDLRLSSFENVRFPIVLLDVRGVPALWNRAFADLFAKLSGQSPEALNGSFFEFLASREGTRLDYYAAEVLVGGRSEALVESPARAEDGSLLWLGLSLSSIRATESSDRRGKNEAFILCAIEDITDRVQRENALRNAKDEAERATYTKSLFLANMSHEIRTPIQTILGIVELLRETRLDTEQSDYVDRVGFSADVLLGLINDILDFSKIEAGKIDLETGNFELRACIYQAVDLLAIEADRKGLELIVDIDESLPAIVRGDERRLRQVLVNLLKNAVKFTQEGSVRLRALPLDSPEGGYIRFEIIDTGPGIPDEVRDNLFTPFFRAEIEERRGRAAERGSDSRYPGVSRRPWAGGSASVLRRPERRRAGAVRESCSGSNCRSLRWRARLPPRLRRFSRESVFSWSTTMNSPAITPLRWRLRRATMYRKLHRERRLSPCCARPCARAGPSRSASSTKTCRTWTDGGLRARSPATPRSTPSVSSS
jgi:PAS domain S-box-containing protein